MYRLIGRVDGPFSKPAYIEVYPPWFLCKLFPLKMGGIEQRKTSMMRQKYQRKR